jgi:putative flippase GtrA
MSSPGPATSRSIAQYFWVACVGYAIDLSSYIGLVQLGLHLYLAYLSSFAVGTVCNVLLFRRFFAPGRHRLAKDISLSFASNGVTIAIAMGIYVALMQLLGLHHVVAKVLSNGCSFLVNYQLRKSWF